MSTGGRPEHPSTPFTTYSSWALALPAANSIANKSVRQTLTFPKFHDSCEKPADDAARSAIGNNSVTSGRNGDAGGRRALGKDWLSKVKSACPDVKWIAHYAIVNRWRAD